MNLISVSLRSGLVLAMMLCAPIVFAGPGAPPPDGVGIYTPEANFWMAYDSSAGTPLPSDFMVRYGSGSNVALAGDWDGDGNKGIGVYVGSSGTFWLQNDTTSSPQVPDPSISGFSITIPGNPNPATLIPIVGNWDNDDADEVGLYDPANGMWYLRDSLDSGLPDDAFEYGEPGLTPVAGNWNNLLGDGIGVYTSSGNFWLKNVVGAGIHDIFVHFGDGTLIPVVGEWVGGTESVGLYNPNGTPQGGFHVVNDLLAPSPTADASFGFGGTNSAYRPVVGTWEVIP